jgi:hypothetical protein
VSLQGALADKIVVTAKKGATVKTCTISTAAQAAANGSWSLASSCDIDVAQTAEAQNWEISVLASAAGVGTALPSMNPAKKLTVPATA